MKKPSKKRGDNNYYTSHNHSNLALTLEEVLDDLCSRFILNLPAEEMKSPERVCFQAELAYWFYEDFYRTDPSSSVASPSLKSNNHHYNKYPYFSLKQFCLKLFEHCPSLGDFLADGEKVFEDWWKYKNEVPVAGAILLNMDKTKCLMVKGWKAKSCWGFPKGKINQDEKLSDCAIREVREETGFDISSLLKEDEYMDYSFNDQSIRLYIINEISEDTPFAPQTRKEISDIAWHSILDATNNNSNRYFNSRKALKILIHWLKGGYKSIIDVGLNEENKQSIQMNDEPRLVEDLDLTLNRDIARLEGNLGSDLLSTILKPSLLGSELLSSISKCPEIDSLKILPSLLHYEFLDPLLVKSEEKASQSQTQRYLSLLKNDSEGKHLEQDSGKVNTENKIKTNIEVYPCKKFTLPMPNIAERWFPNVSLPTQNLSSLDTISHMHEDKKNVNGSFRQHSHNE